MSRNQESGWGVGLISALALIVLIILNAAPPQQTDLDDLLSFNLPGCTIPCVLGITPGETDFDDVPQLVSRHIPSEQVNPDGSFWVQSDNDHVATIRVNRTDPRSGSYVSMIEVFSTSDEPITTLDMVLQQYGSPDRVFRGRVAGPTTVSLLAIFEGGTIMAVVVGDGTMSGDAAIDYLALIAPFPEDIAWHLNNIQIKAHFEDEIGWLGYVPISDYWAANPK